MNKEDAGRLALGIVIEVLVHWQLLRACSISPQQQRQESQIDELQAGIEQALGIFPKPSAFLQQGERSFDDPALGRDGKGMKLMTFSNLYLGTD
jgi:hypothetical protein